MAEPFDSAWIKWAWAIRHAQEFQREVAIFGEGLKPDPLGVSVEYNAKRHGFEVVITDLPEFPATLGVLLGDAVHNFRSALDHIAWAMVERGRTPPDTITPTQQRRVAFPLCDHKAARNRQDSTGWVKSHKSKLPGIRRTDLALVRQFQPYLHGRTRKYQGLAILSALDNLDKHRSIQPVITWPMGGHVEIGEPRDCVLSNDRGLVGIGDPLKIDTELFCIRVRKTGPNPQLEVHPYITVEIAVYEGILWRSWVNGISEDIRTMLSLLGDPPSNIERLGLKGIEI